MSNRGEQIKTQLESKQPIMRINTLRLSEVKQNMIKEYAFIR